MFHSNQPARQPRRLHLTLESLEDRITPSAPTNPFTDLLNTIAANPAPFVLASIAQPAPGNPPADLFNTLPANAFVQASISTMGNGAAQTAINNTLTALSQKLEAIGKELSSVNFLSNGRTEETTLVGAQIRLYLAEVISQRIRNIEVLITQANAHGQFSSLQEMLEQRVQDFH